MKYIRDALTTTDSTLLTALAEKCPFIDGSIIYNARTLYSLVFNSQKHFFDGGCDTKVTDSTTRKSNKTFINSNITEAMPKNGYMLFPNPNAGIFTITQQIHENITAQIDVWNDIGEKVFNKSVKFANGSVRIDLGKVSPGLYMLEITDRDGGQLMTKITIE